MLIKLLQKHTCNTYLIKHTACSSDIYLENVLMKKLFKSEKARWFLYILYKDIGLLVATLVIGVISSVLGLSMAVFSQKLIDNIIPSKDMVYLAKAIGIVIILLLLRVGVGYLQGYIGSIHGKRFNFRLINEFFKKMIFLPKSFFDENKTGGLITRMHDSSAIHSTVMFISNTLILNFLTVIISAAFLFHYSVLIGFITLASFPLYILISYLFKDVMRTRVQEMYVANGENESNYIASIQNMDLIKTHNKQNYYVEQNASKFGWSLEKGFQTNIAGMNFGVSSEMVGNLCYVSILSVAAYQALIGQISIGEFTAILNVATGMLGPIAILGSALMHLQGARVAFDRMYEIVSAKSEFHEAEDAVKIIPERIHSVKFKNVSFSYESNIPLLNNINFSAKSGEIVCVFGRNGAGKSTLLNLLVSLYRPLEGEILINDRTLAEYSIMGIREKIAMVSQQTKLFDGPLLQNVCMSADESEQQKASELLHEYGFDAYIERINGAYAAKLSEDGNNLSGGQKQIIALARALYKNPDVLLVDEATAALDGDSEEFIIKKLAEFSRKGGIVVMVSHRLRPAQAATKIVIIDENSVQHIGDHKSLLLTENIYSKRYLEPIDKNTELK